MVGVTCHHGGCKWVYTSTQFGRERNHRPNCDPLNDFGLYEY